MGTKQDFKSKLLVIHTDGLMSNIEIDEHDQCSFQYDGIMWEQESMISLRMTDIIRENGQLLRGFNAFFDEVFKGLIEIESRDFDDKFKGDQEIYIMETMLIAMKESRKKLKSIIG
jgi:hypothetical protein